MKPIMGLVEDPGLSEEMMRLRKFQKHQAQAKALLDQIEEKKAQKEWEKQQKKLEDEREEMKWRYELELEEENEMKAKNLQSGLKQNKLEKEALEILHKDGKSVRFKGQKTGEHSVIEKLQKDALKSSIEILGAKFRQEVDLMKQDVYDKNR